MNASNASFSSPKAEGIDARLTQGNENLDLTAGQSAEELFPPTFQSGTEIKRSCLLSYK